MVTCPIGLSRAHAQVAAAVLAAMLFAGHGCSTTWAEIHGPRFGMGLEIDDDARVSPRLEAGYRWLQYKDAMGWGAGGVVSYSPVTQWTEVVAEANIWMFPFLGFLQTPVTFRLGGAFHAEDGAALVLGIGLGGLLYKPPAAAYPPLEGAWNGYPPNAWQDGDTVYPDMVPEIVYAAGWRPVYSDGPCTDGADCAMVVHSLTYDTTLAWFLLFGGRP
jgi:hypothetical protein